MIFRSESFIFLPVFVLLLFTLIPVNHGRSSQKVGEEVVIGTDKADLIDSSDGNDNISVLGGNDVVYSGAGDDLVSGGDGDDKISGGAGDDYLSGGEGNDTVTDGAGDDYVSLGPGNDTLVYYLDENSGNSDFASGGEGFDTAVIVTRQLNEVMSNEVIQYYNKEKLLGKHIVDFGELNINLGLKDFDKVVLAASYEF